MILFLFIFFLLISSCLADLAGNWPELDTPPPIQKEFTDLVDLSKVSNASVNTGDLSEDCGTDEYCYWPCTGCLRKNDVDKCSNIGDWGLTFDDGPSNYTSDLIDYFDSKGIKVTFFVVGSRVVEQPEILRKAVKSGHQIGVHTWSHPYLTTQSNEQVIAELQWTAKAIKKATGLVPKYMRPPYGDFDDRIRDICSQLGYTVTIWDRDSQDWMIGGYSDFDINWVTSNFTQWVKEPSSTGHISLEHDIHKESAAQATKVVPILTGANFNIKPVAECLGDDSPYLNKPNNKPSYHLTETSTPTPTSTLKSTDTSRSPSLSPSAAASSGLTRPSPVSSSSKSINYNNWLTILGLMSLILFHN